MTTSVHDIQQLLQTNNELLLKLDKQIKILASLECDPLQVCFADLLITAALAEPNAFNSKQELMHLTAKGVFEESLSGFTINKIIYPGDKNQLILATGDALVDYINQFKKRDKQPFGQSSHILMAQPTIASAESNEQSMTASCTK